MYHGKAKREEDDGLEDWSRRGTRSWSCSELSEAPGAANASGVSAVGRTRSLAYHVDGSIDRHRF